MKKIFTLLVVLSLGLSNMFAADPPWIPFSASFNGSQSTAWEESMNWTVDLLIDSLGTTISAWENPKEPFFYILGSDGITEIVLFADITIESGQTCICNAIDSADQFNFHGGNWYKRIGNLIVEKDATLDMSYRVDTSGSGWVREVYTNGSFAVDGVFNVDTCNLNTRGGSIVGAGVLNLRDGAVLKTKNPFYIGEKYIASAEATDSTEAVEEVNIQGQLVINGGIGSPGSAGFRIQNHNEANTKASIVINSGMAWAGINDLLNTEGKGYGVTRAGQIQVNSTGEFRLTGYTVSDLFLPLQAGVFTSANGTKVPNEMTFDPAEMALAQGLLIANVDLDDDGTTDYVSITANDPVAGLTKLERNLDVSIYPTVSEDGTFVVDASSVSSAVTIAVFTVSGQLVDSSTYSGGEEISVDAQLENGVYLVSVLSEGKIANQKIIVE